MKAWLSKRAASIALILAAAAWGAYVLYQAAKSDFDGPPLGGLCMALPAVAGLLVGAALWPRAKAK